MTDQSVVALRLYSLPVVDVAFGHNYIAATSGAIQLWVDRNLKANLPIGRTSAESTLLSSTVVSIAINDVKKVLAVGVAGRIQLWDLARELNVPELLRDAVERMPVGELDHGRGVLGRIQVAFNATGTLLATAGDDGAVRLWNVDSRSQVGPPLTGHNGKVNAVAFNPSDALLASGGDDGAIRLWKYAL